MKLNPDCIRDILFWLEDVTLPDTDVNISYRNCTPECLNQYAEVEFIYHIQQCINFNLVMATDKKPLNCRFRITDLSPDGHDFLAAVRENNNWNKAKEIASQISVLSLGTLKEISTTIVAGLLTEYFK